LKDADYEGHSFSLLRRIAAALTAALRFALFLSAGKRAA